MTPEEKGLMQLKQHIAPRQKLAFLSAFLIGLMIHMPVMLSDIPNHDGLSSMYFDQNMITSGRWFLSVACGFSSYFTLPWIIRLLGLFFLGLTAAVLVELLDMKSPVMVVLSGGLLVAFPALSSTFAYVFTLDGYMLALFLAVLSVYLTKQYKMGFLAGAVALAFSMGAYQAYLSFAVLLCLYMVLLICLTEKSVKEKLGEMLRYLLMGGIGMALYYGILQALLLIQGKELDTYQGIHSMGSLEKLVQSVGRMYQDFAGFTLKGGVLYNSVYSFGALVVLGVAVLIALVLLMKEKKLWKNPWFFVIIVGAAVMLPVATNLIVVVSPNVNYHLLMRYQWVVYLLVALSVIDRFADPSGGRAASFGRVSACVAACVLLFHYGVSDNIAYSNLEKKYEKTYSYCLRLLDRIEQTPGYYPGIPIAMIGVVGDEQYPVTDISGKVTAPMIGMNGDYLVYTGANYQAFMKYYLGATLNILGPEIMEEGYYRQEYVEMDSFPGADSIRILDGVMYIKTENVNR